ncbi:MAG: AI-2E family transporter [Chloroflexi bacterium]|nr:AI-2E family transporter [Chloroflexota bacterium]
MNKTWSNSFRYWILSILMIALVALIWFARDLIAPLVIAALLAFVLNPAIGYLTQRTRLSRPLAASIVLVIGLSALAALPALILPSLVSEIQILFADLQNILSKIQELLSQPVLILEREFHLESLLPDLTRLFSEGVTAFPESAYHILEATTKNLIWGLVIIAATYYLMRDWARLYDWMLNLVPEPYQPDAHQIYLEIKQAWQGYLRGNLALMLIVGVVFTLAWVAIGLPGALILGITMGVLTIIPDLGPAIAAGFAVLVALFEGSTYLQISNFWFALLVAGIYLLLINIKGVWLRPLIFARSVHMHDGLVFIVIMAAVVLQGILGALVIVPVLASVRVVGRYVLAKLIDTDPFPEITDSPLSPPDPRGGAVRREKKSAEICEDEAA